MSKTNKGYCVICEKETVFIEKNAWLRDNYICETCKSIPRQRAVINALNIFSPGWRECVIHESSPCGVASNFIKKNCLSYSESQFFPNIDNGKIHNGYRCENLERLTFNNNSFDIFITQDVFEHVMNPCLAFREVNRVLKAGGMHIFTIPWYKNKITTQRAKMKENEIIYLEPPIYHGNPVDSSGSLVTYDWGIDFADLIFQYSGMSTIIYLEKNRELGLDAEFLEVFINKKSY